MTQADSNESPAPVVHAARMVALNAVIHVLDKKQPLDSFFEQDREFHSLASRDRNFVKMLVMTVMRRLGQIDDVIMRASDRPEPPNPPMVHHMLRTSAAQILFMNVPDYAAIDTSVSMAESCGMGRQKGFINAVLRAIAAQGQGWITKQDAPRLNTPEWLMKLWIADYGLRTTAEIMQAHMTEAPLDISLKDNTQAHGWAAHLEASVLPMGTLRSEAGGPVQDLPGFADGVWWVQDAAASLPPGLFGDVRGKHVVDLCAAPGGKTAQLAAMGARVTALDRSPTRMRRLKENMDRLQLSEMVNVEIADAAEWRPAEAPEMILLDAPCSATGTIRRHPDISFLKSENDVKNMAVVQERLLQHAIDILAPGGLLIYCTCSLQKSEGEHQISNLLQSGAPVSRMPVIAGEVGSVENFITDEGDVRTMPFHLPRQGGIDGFFISRLRKV